MIVNEEKKSSKLYLATFFLGLAIVLASAINNKVYEISLSQKFGLLGYLPVLFWVGLAIMTASILLAVNKDTKKVFFIKSFALFMIIANIPTMYLDNFDTTDSITHFEHSLSTQNIIKDYNWSWDPYPRDWPGFFNIGFYLFKISSLGVLDFLKYYRVFSSLLTFLALYLFMSRFTKEKELRYAVLISTFIVVWYQLHYSPQSLFLPVTLTIISLLTYKSLLAKAGAMGLSILLAFSHPVNLILLIGMLGGWIFMQLIFRINCKSNLIVYLLLILIFLSWVYIRPVEDLQPDRLFQKYYTPEDAGGTKFFGDIGTPIDTRINMDEVKDNITNSIYSPYGESSLPEGNQSSLFGKFFLEENALIYSSRARMLGLLFMSLMMLLFIILTIKNRSLDRSGIFIISVTIALFIVLQASEIYQKTAWEDRFFLYFAIIVSMAIPKIFGLIKKNYQKILLTAFLVIFIALQFSTIYSKEFGLLIESPALYASDYYIKGSAWDTCNNNNIDDPKIEQICRLDNVYLSAAGVKYREYYITQKSDLENTMDKRIYANNNIELYLRREI